MKDKTLALAGVIQASELVRQAAAHGTWSGYAATACLNSLFKLEAESADEIFGDPERMRLGVETLLAVLDGDNHYAATLRYTVSLLQVQKKFSRERAMQQEIGASLLEISKLDGELEQHEREDRQAHEIAQLYARTISGVSPRIIVQGKPQFLQIERVTDWIRTLLLAGIRSATLWAQLGGNRFELMFGRRRIMQDARTFLAG
jgi:high frequency lysogenization protein